MKWVELFLMTGIELKAGRGSHTGVRSDQLQVRAA